MDKLFAAIAALLTALLGRKAATAAPDAVQPAQAPVAAPEVLPAPASDGLTARCCMELIGHEAIVCEAYLDSKRIWTWGIGITDASGHNAERYIDHPQPLAHCLDIFIWLLRAKYLPAVLRAFAGHPLSEAQLAAALSFHYNTGAIGHASWVALWKAGDVSAARAAFMEWRNPPSIVERRTKECRLFFDGIWSSDGKANVLPVLKPSYQPDFRHAQRLDVMPALQALLGS